MTDTKRPSDDDVLQNELETNHGWRVVEGKEYPVVEPKQEYADLYSDRIERLKTHLYERLIMLDPFGNDHGKRRAFLGGNAYGSFQKRRNKLKGNNLMGVIIDMDEIIIDLKKHSHAVVAKLEAVFDRNEAAKINSYNYMPVEDKVEFVKLIDEMIFKFLQILS
ncbi:MAG: hypothetical protein K9M03_01750 [Kiritimatiellales bacterium]|nr:hypothetical protein [Kiritimatiellales bacterium]